MISLRRSILPLSLENKWKRIRCAVRMPRRRKRCCGQSRRRGASGDSLGGIIECVTRGAPAGLGEPVFDKLEADLAKAMLSLPASKGFEIGSGFAGATMKGSEHNDPFEMRGGKVRTTTNFSGGIQGGISNGENIVFRVAFKPTATIARAQKTITTSWRGNDARGARPSRSLCPSPRGADH